MSTHTSHCFKDRFLSSQGSQERSVVWALFNSLASTNEDLQKCFYILDSLAVSKAVIENFLGQLSRGVQNSGAGVLGIRILLLQFTN